MIVTLTNFVISHCCTIITITLHSFSCYEPEPIPRFTYSDYHTSIPVISTHHYCGKSVLRGVLAYITTSITMVYYNINSFIILLHFCLTRLEKINKNLTYILAMKIRC